MTVTQTSSKVGHFEVDFFHLVYMDFMGSIKVILASSSFVYLH